MLSPKIICCKEPDENTGYKNNFRTVENSKYFTSTGSFAVDIYEADNPGIKIIHVFDASQDMLYRDFIEKKEFISHCYEYGFDESDYKRDFINPRTGNKMLFVGFLPRNTKYKALLIDTVTGAEIKATLFYVQRNLQKG